MDVILAVLTLTLALSAGIGWGVMLIAGILGTSIGFGSAWAIGLLVFLIHRLLNATNGD